MNTQANAETGAPMSTEEKFFGQKTSIADMLPTKIKPEAPEAIQIETDEGVITTPDTTPATAAKPDDDDEELTGYGEKVQKRIAKLTWQAKEAQRKLAEEQSLKDEAIRYARQVNQYNQQQAQMLASGEAQLVERVKTAAALKVEAASRSYKDVYEEGDTDKIIAAQKALNLAQQEEIEAIRYEQDFVQRQQQAQWQQQRQQQIMQQQQPPPPPKPSEESANWAKRNPWFGDPKHRDMTALAYAVHETLIRDEGISPNSDTYYQRIDETVRKRFPEYFGKQANRPSTVVAAGSNLGGRPRTVKLTPTQVALAKQLNLTIQQYAEQVLKGERNG